MQKLVFSDTETFYSDLKKALEQGKQVEVITNYKRYSELPKKLKAIFELDKNKSNEWMNIVTGVFHLNSISHTAINYSNLYILGSATMGMFFGAAVGGPVGATVGTGIGAMIGTIAVATSSGKHHVEIEIDCTGKLRLKIIPISK